MKLNRLKSLAACFALAGAGLGLAGNAAACSVAAWTATNTNATQANTGSRPTVPTYAGLCALSVSTAGTVVADNSPSAETTFRARFYVRANMNAGNAVLFRATSEDNAGGTEVIRVTFEHPGTFRFHVGGADVGTITGASASQWFSVNIDYVAGTSFGASVGGPVATSAPISGATAVNTTIGSSTLGFISGTATFNAGQVIALDEFESSRAATGSIPRICVGDTNATGTRNIADAIRIRNDFLNPAATPAGGMADANENGVVNIADAIIVRNLFLGGQQNCPAS